MKIQEKERIDAKKQKHKRRKKPPFSLEKSRTSGGKSAIL